MAKAIGIATAALGLALFSGTRQACAGGGPSIDSYDGISDAHWLSLHALADVYVSHNFNRPHSAHNQLRAFDIKSEVPSVEFVRITLAHKPQRVGFRAGFRIDAGFGDFADNYLRNDPDAEKHPVLARSLSLVAQALVTVVIPIGRGLVVDAGKFGTPVGMEDNEAQTNWNYSRSLTYTWAEPSAHTGLRATYEPTASTAVSLYWLNGWDSNVLNGSGMRSYAVAALWRPASMLELVAVYAGGLEHAQTRLSDPALVFRNLFNFYVLYKPHDKIHFALSGDVATDRARSVVSWGGIAGYARCQATRWLAVAGRAEFYADPDGATTGIRQRLSSGVLTLDARVLAGQTSFLTRAEYRHDGSTARVFETEVRKSSYTHTQDTLTLGVMLWF
jgi:hypothetical protein